MKILHLITKSEAGGAQTHVDQLCEYFGRQNQVVVMAYPDGWLEGQCKKKNIKFVSNKYFSNSINPIKLFKAIKEVKQIVKEFRPDIIHCHSSGAGFVGRLAIRNKIPTIFTAHGWGFNIGVPFLQKMVALLVEKIASKYCVRIICVSQFVKNLGLKYKIAKKEKFTVIYNGIELKVQGRESQPKAGQPLAEKNQIRIVFVGRLAEPKDPLVLVRAYQSLSDELKDNLEINIVGDGPKKFELEAFIKQNKIENVNLLGSLPREQVFGMMAESDIFVLVSKYEGLPITILEAIGFGLPVVASDVGGVGEIIKDGENGFLIKNNSVEELSEALKKLIKDKDLRETMGHKANEKIKSNFSVDKMLMETEKLYKEILNK